MSRELKFRAWDKKNKCWYGEGDPNNLTFYDFHIFGECTLICPPRTEDLQYLEITQYTNLKDKNGKEIYEGDIVIKDEYIWRDDGVPNYNGTVEWIYSQWQVVAHCINNEKRGISDGINQGLNDEGFEEGENSDWEIIGNIYENPELLK